jgi:hypothetical protein
MLGVSVSTLRRREGDLIQPVIDANGVHRFAESELRAVMVTVRHRQAVASMGPSAGDVAAEVFTLLDEGLHPAEIVKRLRLIPDAVVALYDQWARMHESFVLSKDDADEIAIYARTRAPTTARMMVEQIKTRVETLVRLGGAPHCKFCGDRSASACGTCVLSIRGPIVTFAAKLEQGTSEDGEQQIRVVFDAAWDDTLELGGFRTVVARTDWYRRDLGERSPIVEFVAALADST